MAKSCYSLTVGLVVLAWSHLAFCGEIHDAAKSGDLENVKTLLKGNPDLVFSKDTGGDTPLHWAATMGRRDVVELLLANKADVNAKDYHGYTPLFMAAASDHTDVVKLLLANKADVNAQGSLNQTPLLFAAGSGYKDMTELLLANKADVNAKDINGSTALDYATARGHMFLVELLRQHGGRLRADFQGVGGLGESDASHPANVVTAGDKIGAPPTNWPSYSSELTGLHEVRVKNPNDFEVRVGLRSDGKGKDFIVSSNGTESVNVPNGRYDIYFNYSSDPGGLYQGDIFILENNGAEITITKVVNGNYGIRKVR